MWHVNNTVDSKEIPGCTLIIDRPSSLASILVYLPKVLVGKQSTELSPSRGDSHRHLETKLFLDQLRMLRS